MLSKENDDLVERVMVAEGEWKRVKRTGRVAEVRKKPASATHPGGRKSESGESANKEVWQGGESRSGDSPSLPVKKNKQGEYGQSPRAGTQHV